MSHSQHLERMAQQALHMLGAKLFSQYREQIDIKSINSYSDFVAQQRFPSEIWCAFPTKFVKRLVYEGTIPEVPVIIHIQDVKDCLPVVSGEIRIGTKKEKSRLSYFHYSDNNKWRHFRETGPQLDEPFFLSAENVFYAQSNQQLTSTFSKDANIPFYWTTGKVDKKRHGAIVESIR